MDKRIEELILKLQKSTSGALLDIQLKNVPRVYDLKVEKVENAKVGLDEEKFEEKIDNLWLVNNPSPLLVTRYTDRYFRGSMNLLSEQGKINMPIIIDGSIHHVGNYGSEFIYSERASYLRWDRDSTPRYAICNNTGFKWVAPSNDGSGYIHIKDTGHYTSNLSNAIYTVDFPTLHKNRYIVTRGTVHSDGFISPDIDNKYKLFTCNLIIFKNGELVVNPRISEHGYNLFKLEDYSSSHNFEYVCCYYIVEHETYDNLMKIQKSLDIINSITNNDELYQEFISKIEGDFNFRFDPRLSYKENLDNALQYILSYNQSVLNELFDKESNTYSVTYTGKEFKQKAINNEVRMSRRVLDDSYIGYNNCMMVYINGELYKHHNEISYTGISAKIPIKDISDNDSVEIVYYKNVENTVTPVKIKDGYEIVKSNCSNMDDIIYFTDNTMGHHLYEHHNNIRAVYRRARFVKNYAYRNSVNEYTHITEIEVYTPDGVNVALGKAKGSLAVATDGNYNTYVGTHEVLIDLGDIYDIDYIKVLHYYHHLDVRVYYNHKLEISEDGISWFVVHDASIDGDRYEVPEGNRYNVDPEWVLDKQTDIRYEIPHEKVKFKSPVRYIRNYLNGSTKNIYSHWVEIMAYDINGINVALNKQSSISTGENNSALKYLTDGVIDTNNSVGTDIENGYVQIDLMDIYDISHIKMWHYYADNRKYHNNILQTSIDGETWTTHFDSRIDGEYMEESKGKSIILKPIENELFRVKFLHEDNTNKNYGANYNGMKSMMARYVKHILKCTDEENRYSSWAEIQIISGGSNVAHNKLAYFTDDSTPDYVHRPSMHITNGELSDGVWFDEDLSRPCMIIDLEGLYDIDAIRVYHAPPYGVTFSTSELFISKDGVTWERVYDSHANGDIYVSNESGNIFEFDKTNYIAENYYGKYNESVSKRQFRYHKHTIPVDSTLDRCYKYSSLVISKYNLNPSDNIYNKESLLKVFHDSKIQSIDYLTTHNIETDISANQAIKMTGKICIGRTGLYSFTAHVDEAFIIQIGEKEQYLSWNGGNTVTFEMRLNKGVHDIVIYEANIAHGGRVVLNWKFESDDEYVPFGTMGCYTLKFGLNAKLFATAQKQPANRKEYDKLYSDSILVNKTEFTNKYIAYNNPGSSSGITSSENMPSYMNDITNYYINELYGCLYAPEDGEYKFKLGCNNGYQLYIDDQRCAESYVKQSVLPENFNDPELVDISISLTKGWHKFVLVDQHSNGDFLCVLGWKKPSDTVFSHIPMTYFAPCEYDILPIVKLSKEFIYCQEPSQYIVFHNGRRLSTTEYAVKMPDLDKVYDAPYIIVNKNCDYLDRFDVFYTPEKQLEVFKQDKLKSLIGNKFDGYIDLGIKTLGYPFNPQYASLFVNGKKVAVSDICEITDNSVRIKKDIGTVNNVVVVKNNTFSATLTDLVKHSDIWNSIIRNSSLKDLVTDIVPITDDDISIESPKFDDDTFLTWNLIYNFWIKRFGMIDPSKRFTYNEDESITISVLPKDYNSVYEVYAFANNGTYEHIEYTEYDGDIVTGFKAVKLDGKPDITISIGNWSCNVDSVYHSLSMQIFANFDLYRFENRPYIKLLDGEGNILNNKFAYLDYQNTDNPPIGHWITMYAEKLKISKAVRKIQICIDLDEDGQVVEFKNVFIEHDNKYSSTNLKVIPIDASVVTGHNLPYTVI